MPGGKVKITCFSIAAVAIAMFAAGCAGTKNHTWEGEFDERLEASAAAVEERLGEFQPSSSLGEIFKAGYELGPKLAFKAELIQNLNPPAGCEEVQEEGRRKVDGMAQSTFTLGKDLTPYLHRRLPRPLEEGLAGFKEVERDAAHCATG